MLVTSPLILGQFPDRYGILAIVLIVIGAYILNYHGLKQGFLEPFRTIFYSRGSVYMLIVAFLWSVTANIDKIGVEESSPIFWAFSKDFLILLFLMGFVLKRSKKPLKQIQDRFWPLMTVGFFRTASVISQMFAIQLLLVPYVISIKRTSAVIVVFLGYFFLGETAFFRTKLTGVVIMIIGLILIMLT